MAGGEQVRITQAKGRPMLSWVGKRPLREVRAFPAQLVERFAPEAPAGIVADVDWTGWPERFDRGGLLFHGDNKEVLAHLLANGFRGKVDLVYIDPPFDSGADYVRKVQLRGGSGTARIDGETYTLGEQIQYTDIWANDTYLQFMYERLLLLKELLAADGSFWLHADARRVAQLRLVLDEVFGEDAFRNQVVWRRTSSHGGANRFGAVTDHLLLYAPDDAAWNAQFQEMTQVHLDRHYRHKDDRGVHALGELTAPGTRRGPTGSPWRGFDVTAMGRHWGNLPTELDRLDGEGLIYWPATVGAWPRVKRYLADSKGRPGTDFWNDIDVINMVGLEREDYPTQKPEALLDRIIRATSNPGDIVLDCFIGSGTTAAVAQKLGRRWIGADINKGAIQTTEKRLAAIIGEQLAAGTNAQLALADDAADAPPKPAQLGFSVHRVNDYDLQIQHNEAVELAVQHLGVARTRADTFFHGTLGRELVHIVPFDHPATPLDLQAVESELRARPGEDRDVVLVALGRELSTRAWLDGWNRHRPVNRIRLVDLRTDPKHGRFFEHRPAEARVTFEREADRVRVRIVDVLSPSILERLAGQEGILQPRVDDWRAMVDTVAIDPSYDGSVFEVGRLDVPARKRDLVDGTYDVPVEAASADPVAVRITDMLGEEILVVEPRVPADA